MGIEFDFFKAGYGDSILVRTDKGTNILIDGGLVKSYKDIKKSKKIDKLKKLDLVVLTHIDSDHINGLI
jgi:beta-lactamase superfamily II metal-dependent hydrolase